MWTQRSIRHRKLGSGNGFGYCRWYVLIPGNALGTNERSVSWKVAFEIPPVCPAWWVPQWPKYPVVFEWRTVDIVWDKQVSIGGLEIFFLQTVFYFKSHVFIMSLGIYTWGWMQLWEKEKLLGLTGLSQRQGSKLIRRMYSFVFISKKKKKLSLAWPGLAQWVSMLSGLDQDWAGIEGWAAEVRFIHRGELFWRQSMTWKDRFLSVSRGGKRAPCSQPAPQADDVHWAVLDPRGLGTCFESRLHGDSLPCWPTRHPAPVKAMLHVSYN